MVCRLKRLLDDCVPAGFAETAAAADPAPASGRDASATAAPGDPELAAPASGPAPAAPLQRKRKERHESIGSAQERKVVRSNSEERPLENGVSHSRDSIRRVSSHEDFSLVRSNRQNQENYKPNASDSIVEADSGSGEGGDGDSSSTSSSGSSSSTSSSTTTTTNTLTATAPTNITNNTNNTNNHNKSFLSEVIDTNMGHGVRMAAHGMPLHERNESQHPESLVHSGATGADDEFIDDSEHERRRSSERFSRAAGGMSRGRRSNMARRRRPTHAKSSAPTVAAEDADGGSSSKENEEQDRVLSRSPHQMQTAVSSDDEGHSSCSSSSHSFLQLHPQPERERVPSPEPSPGVVGGPPPLDLSTLHQQFGGAEPLTSRATWSREGGEHEELIANSRVMLSPRNSLILSRRVYLDTNVPASPPHERESMAVQIAQARLKQVNKQMSSLKKKLKRLEEEFERDHGYRPSHAEKSTHKDMKRICSELSKLRKESKQLKEDPHNADIDGGVDCTENGASSTHKPALTMEEVLQEVQQHLADKRKTGGRPETLEELTREQLVEEKVAVQKALLHLEDMYGRPVTKGDRDLLRPLYDRYRMLKRMVIRTAPSKMKDSISELATIHEHEQMDFTSSPPSLAGAEDSQDNSMEAAAAAAVVAAPPAHMHLSESSEALWKNLHSLSLSELLSQQRATREEKKRLRRSLREFEEDFQLRTGKKLQREDRQPMEGVYTSYKQAKAKLRLLDALVSKVTS